MRLAQLRWPATIAALVAAATAVWVGSHLGDVTTLWAITVTTAWAAATAAVAFAVAYGVVVITARLPRR